MRGMETALDGIGAFDRLALLDTPIHRLDPRAKLLTAAAFVVAVASFDKYDVAGLTPMFLYPAVMISLGRLPILFLLRWIILASPFAVMVGIWNPILDREAVCCAGTLTVPRGILSFASIMLKFVLTASVALILLGTKSYVANCSAAGRLGMPGMLVAQFLFLHRYLFVLSREAVRMKLAHALRSGGRPVTLREWVSLAGYLLLRSLERGRRVHMAMLCRGFDGEVRTARPLRFSQADFLFVGGWWAFFLAVRISDIPGACLLYTS
ncbi:MAG: cobalt ECF transporter T component CbiQ, partial [Planctomycetota bacterium]|nr:cobalt ECF transporter T component CbiQ [Planctomycetota bacterium]